METDDITFKFDFAFFDMNSSSFDYDLNIKEKGK